MSHAADIDACHKMAVGQLIIPTYHLRQLLGVLIGFRNLLLQKRTQGDGFGKVIHLEAHNSKPRPDRERLRQPIRIEKLITIKSVSAPDRCLKVRSLLE
jgi:hypothetical protein